MIPETFFGNYKLISQENSDRFMEALGVGVALRALSRTANIRLHVSKEGDDQMCIHTTGLKDSKLKAQLGTEIEHETPDGRKVKSVFTVEGPNKVVQREEWDGKTIIHTYDINGDDLTVVILLDDIRCVRKFKRTD